MKILIVTNLFPNAKESNRSTFNFQQFSALSKFCELKVVAPVPCFQYFAAQVPLVEKIGGIDVFHPRYLVIPKTFRFTYGFAFFVGIWQTLRTIYASFKYDAILVAWAYPDAFGAAIAARLLKKRLFVLVLGSDINFADKYWLRVPMIKWALRQAERVVAVSRPLKEKVISMGISDEKVVVVPNGVNKEKFFPMDRAECRKKLGLNVDKKYVLFVGNLVEVKGVEYLIRAFRGVGATAPFLELLIVGDGPLKGNLENLAETLGIKGRVHFKGRQPHDLIPVWLNAADVFCLPSLNEGCPNVVLEALACGVKVVASRTGGIPDIIDSPDKGWLAEVGNPESLAECLSIALEGKINVGRVATISWDENARQLFEIIK